MKYKPKPEKWFIKRIGKRIYRDTTNCNDGLCDSCADVAKNGIIVENEEHAKYMAMIDMDFGAEGVFLNYRDNK